METMSTGLMQMEDSSTNSDDNQNKDGRGVEDSSTSQRDVEGGSTTRNESGEGTSSSSSNGASKIGRAETKAVNRSKVSATGKGSHV